MRCFKCGYNNPEGAKYCINCGAKLKLICPECGFAAPEGSKYCPHCGAKLNEENEKKIQVHSKGERKNIAVMFADLSEFTSLSTKLDPEELREIMSNYFALMTPVVHKYDGYIDKFIGDSIMALFGAPIAYEDASLRAVLCGMDLIDTINNYKTDMKYKRSLSIGINYGLVATGKLSEFGRYTVMGEVVNLAKRLESSAQSGEVLVSKSVYENTKQQIKYAKPRKIKVKGFTRVISAYKPIRVIKITPFRRIGEISLVGRKKELEMLRETFRKTESGSGQIVKIVGEPGIGKSKLTYEFANELNGQAIIANVQGADYLRDSPYRFLREILQIIFHLSKDAKGVEQNEAIERKLNEWSKNIPYKSTVFYRALPFIKYLLNLPLSTDQNERFKAMRPSDRIALINETITDFLLHLSRLSNILLIIDDAQWGDISSMDFFVYLSERIKNTGIMMIYTYRIGMDTDEIKKVKANKMIRLLPLNKKETVNLACKLLDCSKLSGKVEKAILQKTEGNPFYIEEFTTAMKNSGLIKIDDNTASASVSEETVIPDRLKEIILSKVDRLDEDVKNVLRYAAVIGDEFSLNILSFILGNGEKVRAYLNLLIEERFLKSINKRTSIGEGTETYMFKHAITKDVIYNSILMRERKRYHGQIALTYEKIYRDNLVPYYDIIALHYTMADLKPQSFNYLKLSAERLKEMNRQKEALDRYKKCLEIKREPEIYFSIGKIYETMGDYEEAEKAYDTVYTSAKETYERVKAVYEKASLFELQSRYDEAIALLRKADIILGKNGNNKRIELERARILALESWIFRILGDSKGALNTILKAEKIVNRFENEKWDKEALSVKREVFNNLGVLYLWTGKLEESLKIFERIVAFSKKLKDKRVLVSAYNNIALVYENLGEFDLALKFYKRNLKIVKELGNKHSLARIYGNMGRTYGEMNDYRKSVLYFKRYLKISEFLNRKRDVGIAYGNLGVTYQGMGNYKKAFKYLDKYYNISREIGDKAGMGIASLNFSEVYYELEDFEKAEEWAKKSLKITKESNMKYYLLINYHNLFHIAVEMIKEGKRKSLEQAEKYLKRLKDISEEIGIDEGRAHLLVAKGIMLDLKEPQWKDNDKILQEVTKYFDEAIGMFKKSGDKKKIAETFIEFGEILEKRKDKRAGLMFKRARDVYKKLHMENRAKQAEERMK